MTEFVRKVLGGSRYVVLLAVLGTFISAVVLTLYGLVAVTAVTVRSFTEIDGWNVSQRSVEHFALELIALIDIFLLGTVLYIIALGLYELFIDPNLPLPPWLLIEDLDDLKEKLGGVVIVLIAVTFLGDFVESDGEIGILWLGLGGAAIILAVAVAFAVRPRHGHHPATLQDHLPRITGHTPAGTGSPPVRVEQPMDATPNRAAAVAPPLARGAHEMPSGDGG
jgi:uncharacterized membrane protein YqhA